MEKNTTLAVRAEVFATEAHDGQFRKNNITPYITHPIGVAKLVKKAGGSDEQIAIALLHDVIEDCEGYDYEKIKNAFGGTIADGVIDLTNTSKQVRPELNRAARKALDNEKLEKIPLSSRLVKLCDIYYNVHDMDGMGGFAKRFLSEKRVQVEAVANDDLLANPQARKMYDEIIFKCEGNA